MVDPDLRGFMGGFAAGRWGFLVPFKNHEAEAEFSGKMVRFDLLTFDHASVTVSVSLCRLGAAFKLPVKTYVYRVATHKNLAGPFALGSPCPLAGVGKGECVPQSVRIV